MKNLKIDKIGHTPILLDTTTNTKTSFKGGMQDLVNYINRFKLAEMAVNINDLPVFFLQQIG